MTEKKKGRPVGAKTIDGPVLEAKYDPCPNCGCTREPVKRRFQREDGTYAECLPIAEGAASGEKNGRPYSYFRRFKANCAACGFAVRYITYDYIDTRK